MDAELLPLLRVDFLAVRVLLLLAARLLRFGARLRPFCEGLIKELDGEVNCSLIQPVVVRNPFDDRLLLREKEVFAVFLELFEVTTGFPDLAHENLP